MRDTFAAAAARRLGVEPATLTVRDGSFVSATGGSIDYWRLLDEVDLHQEITGNVAPKPSSAYRLVGQSVPRRDLPRKLSGAAYVHDLDLPDMWHGRIVRPPSSDAQLAGVDEERLRSRVPAVQIVVDGRFVGVVCTARGGRLARDRGRANGGPLDDARRPARPVRHGRLAARPCARLDGARRAIRD